MSNFTLTAVLAADTADFDSKMKSAAMQTRAWQKTATELFKATQTPAEQHRAAMLRVSDAYAMGKINLDVYQRSVEKLNQEWYVASGGAAKLRAQIDAINASAMAGSGRMAAVQGAVGRLNSASMAFLPRLGGMAAGMSTFAIAAGAHQSLRLAEDFETTSVSMEVLMRDAAGAKRLIDDLYQYAAHTPFEFQDVAQAGKQLLGYGEAAEQIMPDIKMLGNIASALDIPLTELANVVGRNRNQLHLYTRDINELANRGVPVIQYLAKQFGVATSEVKGLVEDGKVGFDDLRGALEAMTGPGGQFEGMTDRLGKTMKGIRTTAIDELKASMRELGNTMGDAVLPRFAELTKSLNDLVQLKAKGFEETDTGKLLATSQSRHAEADPFATAASSADQLTRLNEEIAAQSKQHGDLSKRLSQTTFGSPGVWADVERLNASINGLLRERQLIQQRLNVQTSEYGDFGKLIGRGIKVAINEAGGFIKAGEEAAKTWGEKVSQGADKVQEKIRGLLGNARNMAEEGKRLRQVIEGARSPAQVYDRTKEELDKFLEKEEISQRTYDEALRKAQEKRDRDQESRSPELQAMKKMADEAKRLKDDVLTPLEKYQQDLERIQRLGAVTDENGAFVLSDEDLKRARHQAEENLLKTAERSESSENKALSRGSSEAFNAINRANDRKKTDELLEQQRQILERHEILLQRVADNTGDSEIWTA